MIMNIIIIMNIIMIMNIIINIISINEYDEEPHFSPIV